VSLGWLRTRVVSSVGGQREPETAAHRPRYGNPLDRDGFLVYWGDYSLYKESATDVVTLGGDGRIVTRTGSLAAGVALTYEEVYLREMDWLPYPFRAGDEGLSYPVDSIRTYHAAVPGGHAYVQGRWESGGLVLNTGLRAEYFTAGSTADEQTLPGSSRGVWSIAPRLGIAYPISVRDVFSLAYVRIHQSPGRDFLYDRRTAITNRQPLGNPALEPAVLISYEAAVKHVFATWALQGSVFYRDVFNQIGALDLEIPEGPINVRYVDQDRSHTLGFEWSVIHDRGQGRRLEAHYVWMNAWGNESRPEGDPYGPLRSPRIPAIGERPVSWDRRHSLLVSGTWTWRRRWSVAWSSAVLSPLPWTPKPRRVPFTDLGQVNSRRLDWSENTNLSLHWTPPYMRGLTIGLEARNLFDHRGQRTATVNGYPNPVINTVYDDYSAYRNETGRDGAAYWSTITGGWVLVDDPRLYNPPRTLRLSVGTSW
jgi:hypothetical protein